ncbi:uncharacterized protein LOC34620666 [Cyclospora cayetanensis]|uniref:Uncharacterized protein LOC34620666 n=1 Tax=Cyclospora cayetanensis TaxID=88456 RepID=A0A6P6S0Y8_9EIME|nr:uncharacterized protein LOC34620666 [Cyclospora cayetanensis]
MGTLSGCKIAGKPRGTALHLSPMEHAVPKSSDNEKKVENTWEEAYAFISPRDSEGCLVARSHLARTGKKGSFGGEPEVVRWTLLPGSSDETPLALRESAESFVFLPPPALRRLPGSRTPIAAKMDNLSLIRRLLRGSQQTAASQASQASLSALQARAGAPGSFVVAQAASCESCGSTSPCSVDHSGYLICVECGARQEGQQIGTRDEEAEFQLLQASGAMGSARIRASELLGSDAVAAALATVGFGGGASTEAGAPVVSVPAAPAKQRTIDEEEEGDSEGEWGERGGAASSTAAAAAAAAARVSRQQQQALGSYWQHPLLWLNAEEAAGETIGSDGAVSDAALLRCWALLLQATCRLLQDEFGISDLLELEAKKVLLQYLSFLSRHELPVETFFCNIASKVIKVPTTRIVSHTQKIAEALQAQQQELLQDPLVPPLLKEAVRFMGLDRLAYVQQMLPARSSQREAFSRRRLRLLTRREMRPLSAAAVALPQSSGQASIATASAAAAAAFPAALPPHATGGASAPSPLGEAVMLHAAGRVATPARRATRGGCAERSKNLPQSAQGEFVALPFVLPPAAVRSRDARVADRLAAVQRLLPLVEQRRSELLEEVQEQEQPHERGEEDAGEVRLHAKRQQLLAAATSAVAALGPPSSQAEAAAIAAAAGAGIAGQSRRRKRTGGGRGSSRGKALPGRGAHDDHADTMLSGVSPDISRPLLRLVAHERSLALGSLDVSLGPSQRSAWRRITSKTVAEIVDAVYEHDFVFLLLLLKHRQQQQHLQQQLQQLQQQQRSRLSLPQLCNTPCEQQEASLDAVDDVEKAVSVATSAAVRGAETDATTGGAIPVRGGASEGEDSDEDLPLSLLPSAERRLSSSASGAPEIRTGAVGADGASAVSKAMGFPRGTLPLCSARFRSGAHCGFYSLPASQMLPLDQANAAAESAAASRGMSTEALVVRRPEESFRMSEPSARGDEASPERRTRYGSKPADPFAAFGGDAAVGTSFLLDATDQLTGGLRRRRGAPQPGALPVDVSLPCASQLQQQLQAFPPRQQQLLLQLEAKRGTLRRTGLYPSISPDWLGYVSTKRLQELSGLTASSFFAAFGINACEGLGKEVEGSAHRGGQHGPRGRVTADRQKGIQGTWGPETELRATTLDLMARLSAVRVVWRRCVLKACFRHVASVTKASLAVGSSAVVAIAQDGDATALPAARAQENSGEEGVLLVPLRSCSGRFSLRRVATEGLEVSSIHPEALGPEPLLSGVCTANFLTGSRLFSPHLPPRLPPLDFDLLLAVLLLALRRCRVAITASDLLRLLLQNRIATLALLRLAPPALWHQCRVSTGALLQLSSHGDAPTVAAAALQPQALPHSFRLHTVLQDLAAVGVGGAPPLNAAALIVRLGFALRLPPLVIVLANALLQEVLPEQLLRLQHKLRSAQEYRHIKIPKMHPFVPSKIRRPMRRHPPVHIRKGMDPHRKLTSRPVGAAAGGKVTRVDGEGPHGSASSDHDSAATASFGLKRRRVAASRGLSCAGVVEATADAASAAASGSLSDRVLEGLPVGGGGVQTALVAADYAAESVSWKPQGAPCSGSEDCGASSAFMQETSRRRNGENSGGNPPSRREASPPSVALSSLEGSGAPRKQTSKRGPRRLPWGRQRGVPLGPTERVELSPSGVSEDHPDAWRLLAPRSKTNSWGCPLAFAAGSCILLSLRLLYGIMQWQPAAPPSSSNAAAAAAAAPAADLRAALRMCELAEHTLKAQARHSTDGSRRDTGICSRQSPAQLGTQCDPLPVDASIDCDASSRRNSTNGDRSSSSTCRKEIRPLAAFGGPLTARRLPLQVLRWATDRFFVYLDGISLNWVIGIRHSAEAAPAPSAVVAAFAAGPAAESEADGFSLYFFPCQEVGERRAGRKALRFLLLQHCHRKLQPQLGQPPQQRDDLLPPPLLRLFLSPEGGDLAGLLEYFESVEAEAEGTSGRILSVCGGGEAEEALLEQQLLLQYKESAARSRRQQQQPQQRPQLDVPSWCWKCQLPPPLVSPVASGAVTGAFHAVRSHVAAGESTQEQMQELSLPAVAEADRTTVLDADLGMKAWTLGPLLHQQQALQRAEELLVCRPLHSHAAGALAAARTKAAVAAAAAAAAASADTQQQQHRQRQQQESGAIVETEGDAMPLAEVAEDLEKAVSIAAAVFGHIGVLQDHSVSAAEACQPCILIPLQPAPRALVQRFAEECFEELPLLPLPSAAVSAAATARQQALECLREQQRQRLQWLGTPYVCYEGTAESLYQLLVAALLQQMGCADCLMKECRPQGLSPVKDSSTPGELLAVDAPTVQTADALPHSRSLVGRVAELTQSYCLDAPEATRDSGPSPTAAVTVAQSDAQRPLEAPQQLPHPESEQQEDLHSKYAAPDWSFSAFLPKGASSEFGLRGGDASSGFLEGAGCGSGRALPLRLENACSFATSKATRLSRRARSGQGSGRRQRVTDKLCGREGKRVLRLALPCEAWFCLCCVQAASLLPTVWPS